MAITTGVQGAAWRADVNAWGGIEPWDASAPVEWYVAADDRWHIPATESSVRQGRIGGTPVVETRLRIPGGDAVHTVYSVADHGGWTIVEVRNESSLPIAVAFDSPLVVSGRPPSDVPAIGIDLPAGSRVFPVGHRAAITAGIAHSRPADILPAGLPPAEAVVRGWLATADRAGRVVLPETRLTDDLVAARCEAMLTGLADPRHRSVEHLVAAGQVVRMGERADPLVPDVATAVERLARVGGGGWSMAAAVDAAAEVLAAAGERRALSDLEELRRRRVLGGVVPPRPPIGVLLPAWIEQTFADRQGQILAGGWPAGWRGHDLEAHGVPVGHERRLSLAVRWHGARPAVLWELSGPPLNLSAPAVAPGWSTTEPRGEALWPAPVGDHEASRDVDEPTCTVE